MKPSKVMDQCYLGDDEDTISTSADHQDKVSKYIALPSFCSSPGRFLHIVCPFEQVVGQTINAFNSFSKAVVSIQD
jgi:hypothetical protein